MSLEASNIDLHKIAPRRLAEVNKEWWVLLGLLVVAAVLNYFAALNQMLLGLYTLPTLLSAYLFGRRHAILTAFASVFTAIIIFLLHGFLTTSGNWDWTSGNHWYEIAVWGGILVVTAYAMGTLFREVREVYRTLHLILQYQMKNGLHVENSVFRITEYARAIAQTMDLSSEQIDDLRRAATLVEIFRHIDPEIFEKTARLAQKTYFETDHKSTSSDTRIEDPLPRVVSLLEACNGQHGKSSLPDRGLAKSAGILRLAIEYADMTSEVNNRHALSPVVAKNLITRSALAKNDPEIVDAFVDAFRHGRMEALPLILIQKLRRYSRVPMVVPIEITTDSRSFHARTEMLGGGGMCLVTPERLEISKSVRASFDLPRMGNVLVRGSVVWARPSEDRIGLEFEPSHEQRAVDEWIANLFRDLLSQPAPSGSAAPAVVAAAAKATSSK